MTAPPLDVTVEHLLREWTPRVLGTVVRRFRDFAAAEDAVQEASLAAAMQWPREGLPEHPGAWLTRVACRRMADHVRSESARRRRENEVAQEATASPALPAGESAPQEDDTLVLLFLCCHPALTRASAIALTLRAVGGLTTAEIAHAFLVPESTLAQRISRAKQSIKSSGIPFQLPTAEERGERLRAVLHILYLIFNEGYTASAGPALRRADLSQEAIRLTRIVHHLQPDDPEVAGLLALLLLTDARRLARTDAAGELIPLARQDRALWDQEQIAEGIALLSATLPRGAVGPYQLQAAIAAVHDEAARAEDTDWPQILALYDLLRRMSDNPMVALNHAIAAAMVHGPEKGLELLDTLEGDARLAGHHRLDAVRAHLLELAGEPRAGRPLLPGRGRQDRQSPGAQLPSHPGRAAFHRRRPLFPPVTVLFQGRNRGNPTPAGGCRVPKRRFPGATTARQPMKTGFRTLETSFQPLKTGNQAMKTSFLANTTGFYRLETSFQALETGIQRLESCFEVLETGYHVSKTGFQELKTGFRDLKTSFRDLKTGCHDLKSGFQDPLGAWRGRAPSISRAEP